MHGLIYLKELVPYIGLTACPDRDRKYNEQYKIDSKHETNDKILGGEGKLHLWRGGEEFGGWAPSKKHGLYIGAVTLRFGGPHHGHPLLAV